jgi:hypothetical protein
MIRATKSQTNKLPQVNDFGITIKNHLFTSVTAGVAQDNPMMGRKISYQITEPK